MDSIILRLLDGVFMKNVKQLDLIFDNTKVTFDDNDPVLEEIFQLIHSLGLKCDSVGWTKLDFTKPNAEECLMQIEEFVKEHKYLLRGMYREENWEIDSDWYALYPTQYIPFNDDDNYEVIEDQNGKEMFYTNLKSYKIPSNTPILFDNMTVLVSDTFRKFCIEKEFTGVDFYWIKDIGKYDGPQFFGLKMDNKIDKYACDEGLDYSPGYFEGAGKLSYLWFKFTSLIRVTDKDQLKSRYSKIGGIPNRLYKSFYDLSLDLPIYLPKHKMPDTDFAYVNHVKYNFTLIRKNVAYILLKEKLIKKEHLMPILMYDTAPKGYAIRSSGRLQYPADTITENLWEQYEKILAKERPKRKITEKDALKLLRQIKKERGEDFDKALSKKKREELVSTKYESLIPYYGITRSCDLSDEYYLITYEDAVTATDEFVEDMEKENLEPIKPSGIVFGKCANGDFVILSDDNKVKKIGHEGGPHIIAEWDNLASFVYDVLEESLMES